MKVIKSYFEKQNEYVEKITNINMLVHNIFYEYKRKQNLSLNIKRNQINCYMFSRGSSISCKSCLMK
jgi:hypothetical protein